MNFLFPSHFVLTDFVYNADSFHDICYIVYPSFLDPKFYRCVFQIDLVIGILLQNF